MDILYIFCVVLSRSVLSDSLEPHGLYWLLGISLCKNTGVSCHALLQGIFPTQGLNPGLPHCRWILYHLSHQGSPVYIWNIIIQRSGEEMVVAFVLIGKVVGLWKNFHIYVYTAGELQCPSFPLLDYPFLPGSCPGWSRVFEAGTASATYLFKYFIKDIKSNSMRIAQ